MVSTLPQNFYVMNATGYFTHKDCHLHEMGLGHPECPERLDAIDDRLLASGVRDALTICDVPLANTADILLAHDALLMTSLQDLSARLAEDVLAGGPTQYSHPKCGAACRGRSDCRNRCGASR
jgi:acetoin utilization deacetylase AcuC-like enzyme